MYRSDFIREARALKGVPFVHTGRSRDGVDCIGVILLSLDAAGWTALSPETSYVDNYQRSPDGHTIEEYLSKEADVIARGLAQPGDIVVMRFGKEPQHLAILTPPPAGCEESGLYIVHSVDGVMGGDGVVECSYDTKHRSRTKNIWRIKGFEGEVLS